MRPMICIVGFTIQILDLTQICVTGRSEKHAIYQIVQCEFDLKINNIPL